MKLKNVESAIVDAARSPNWWAVPEAIANWRDQGEATTGMVFWRRAAASAGKSEHALRQMCGAYDFVRAHSPHMPPDFVALALGRPYTHLELLARIAESDFERAASLIFSPGNVQSVRDLRKVLDEVRAQSTDDTSALVEGQQTRSHALAIVADQMPRLVAPRSVGVIRFQKWSGTTASVSPSLVAIRLRPDGRPEAVGVFVSVKPSVDALHRAIARVGWDSTFFDVYWLAVPTPVASEAGALVRQYRLDNVGLVTFDAASSLLTLAFAPTEGAPAPDRRGLLRLPERYRR